jgi:hypothetical protein
MEPIISVDTKRKKVLVTINDTFNIDCSPTQEIEDLVAGSNENIFNKVVEKLDTYNFTFPTRMKWRYIVRAKGFAAAECPIVEK